LLEHGLEPASARPADPAIEPETPVAETNAIPVPPEPMAEPG